MYQKGEGVFIFWKYPFLSVDDLKHKVGVVRVGCWIEVGGKIGWEWENKSLKNLYQHIICSQLCVYVIMSIIMGKIYM